MESYKENIMNKIVLFDVDGTIVDGQSQKHFLKFLLKKKLISRAFYYKLLAWFILYKVGFVSDPKRPMRFAFSFLAGLGINEFESYVNEFCNEVLSKRLYSESLQIITDHVAQGHKVILVSNSMEPLVKKIAEMVGASDYIASTLETRNGKYTGAILNVVYGENKVDSVKTYLYLHNISVLDESWAYGDHYSDVPILSITDHPYAVNPDRKLKKYSRLQGWDIVYNSLHK